MKTKLIILALLVTNFMPMIAPLVSAQSQVPEVNINDEGFKLVICDGPGGPLAKSDPNYKVCDFQALMDQVQYLINVMIVLGVIGALVGFAYSGYLHITGVPGNITKAWGIFKKVAIGFVIMLTAWFVVYQILEWLTGNAANYLGNG
ncbi:MAG: hypothetical protein WCV82_00440 [Candidatus Paceibacterota bacterium]